MKQLNFKLEGPIMALKHRFKEWLRQYKVRIKYQAALRAIEHLEGKAITETEKEYLAQAGVWLLSAADERGYELI